MSITENRNTTYMSAIGSRNIFPSSTQTYFTCMTVVFIIVKKKFVGSSVSRSRADRSLETGYKFHRRNSIIFSLIHLHFIYLIWFTDCCSKQKRRLRRREQEILLNSAVMSSSASMSHWPHLSPCNSSPSFHVIWVVCSRWCAFWWITTLRAPWWRPDR